MRSMQRLAFWQARLHLRLSRTASRRGYLLSKPGKEHAYSGLRRNLRVKEYENDLLLDRLVDEAIEISRQNWREDNVFGLL